MSFTSITKDLFENTSITLKPEVHFVSSSAGVTGSAQVSALVMGKATGSSGIKDIVKPPPDSGLGSLVLNAPGYDEGDYEALTLIRSAGHIVNKIRSQGLSSADISGFINRYLEAVNDAPHSLKHQKAIDVFRFDPPITKFQKNSAVKNNIRKVLMPYHRVGYQNCEFSYSNYHTLNFFTGSIFPTSSCLIYPNKSLKTGKMGIYNPGGSFTLDFWINPRYQFEAGTEVKAGTIFHMSSSIALSLLTGSSVDGQGKVNKYRLLLQLSHSADKPPSNFNPDNLTGIFPDDLVFASDDDVLDHNKWQHVTVRWGGLNVNNASGSIVVGEINSTSGPAGKQYETPFRIPSASLMQDNFDAIFLGNFYDGPNLNVGSGDAIVEFFNSNASSAEGVTFMGGTADPSVADRSLAHPLNAEIHDVKLYNKYLFNSELDEVYNKGPTSKDDPEGLIFYVPPFYQMETRKRDVLVTPFQKIVGTTGDPFNVSFSFGVGGKLINLENFTRELIQGEFPRLYHLTASIINKTIENITADEYVYGEIPYSKLSTAGVDHKSGSIGKRNFTILPNDNGQFRPNYFPIVTSSDALVSFQTPGGGIDYSNISLENLIPTSSLYEGLVFQTGSIFEQVVGASPENPGVAPGAVLTIAQRTRDLSSNEIVVFDISNLYYGNRIHPGSFIATDEALTGSRGLIGLTFKDNGIGGLYRADCLTSEASFTNYGNIFYDEGIAVIKTPHAFYFAKDKTDLKFKGEHNMHVMTLNAFCPQGLFNSSSNPQYKLLSASNDTNDDNSKFVYITGINVHDDNLNVIMRANLAQPVIKRDDDGFLFKIKKDF
jgi:hypothetical protein